jgi:hypothetical protein
VSSPARVDDPVYGYRQIIALENLENVAREILILGEINQVLIHIVPIDQLHLS